MKYVFRKLNLLLMAIGLSASPLMAGRVDIGSSAPDFTLMGIDGKAYSLSDFKGKYVVLEWFNHSCPFVTKHYDSNNMPTLQEAYGEKGVIWLSINSTNPTSKFYKSSSQALELANEKRMHSYAILTDADGEVGRTYGARTTPHIFIIDPNGMLIYKGAIDSIASANINDLSKATNYVKAALGAHMDGKPVETSSTKAYGCRVKYN